MSGSSTDPSTESSSSFERFAQRLPYSEKSIILASASTRSLAESAVAAGFTPICCDFFGDQDLLSLLDRIGGRWCALDTVGELPHLLRDVPFEIPVCWAGGFEHAKECLEQLAVTRPVFGATREAIEKVRLPENLEAWMRPLPVQFPAISRVQPSADGAWLAKRMDGAGGLGVQRYCPGQPLPQRAGHPDPAVYFQRSLDGVPCSAMVCTAGCELYLLGVSLQLCGWECLGATEFRFCGNVGPVEIPKAMDTCIRAAAMTVAHESGLRGVFGLDFLLTARGLFLLEVNPRIPASHWIYDRGNAGLSISAHLHAVQGQAESLRKRMRHFRLRREPALQCILWTDALSTKRLLAEPLWILPPDARLADLPAASAASAVPPIGTPLLSVLLESNTAADLVKRVRLVREPDGENRSSRWEATADRLRTLLARWNQLVHEFQDISDSTAEA